jgi:hypothetical protein
VLFDDILRDPQPKTRTDIFLRGEERLENLSVDIRSDARTFICDLYDK